MMFYAYSRWRGLAAASGLVAALLLLAACGGRQNGPAPLVLGSETGPPPAADIVTAGVAPAGQVTVRRGQSLSGIARAYHVPLRAVAEANHLRPPYRIMVGQVLVIPGAGVPPPAPATVAASPSARQNWAAAYAPPPMPPPPGPAPVVSATRLPAPTPRAAMAPRERPLAETPPAPVPPKEQPPAVAAAPARRPADEAEAAAANPASHAPPSAVAAAEPHAEKRPAGTFLWPVRGRVIARFGAAADGTHNDGINIAAPRGAAIEAVDGGTVAYVGNELRGYGNLILVKHANGWISAYAHCDLILVRRGQKVSRGQTIARVGMTGNVSEPQLHFELRRGDHPVDPLGHLAPLPTATARSGLTRG